MAIVQSKQAALLLSCEDRKKICEAWSKSNLSRSEFIRRNNLPNAFHNWCNKLLSNAQVPARKETLPISKERFIEVVPDAEPNNGPILINKAPETILVNINTKELCCTVNVPAEKLLTVLKEICHAAATIR